MARLYIPFVCAAFVIGTMLSYVLAGARIPTIPVSASLLSIGVAYIIGAIFGKPYELFGKDEHLVLEEEDLAFHKLLVDRI